MIEKKAKKVCQDSSLTVMILIDILDKMGGAERNIYILAKGLTEHGHKIIVCPLKGGLVSQRMQREGFYIRELNVTRIYDLKGLKTLIKLLALIKKESVSALLTYHESSDFLGLLVAFLSGIPVVSSRRDTGFKLKSRHIKVYQSINRFFDHILANSSAVKESIIKVQKSKPGHVSVIPNGVDLPSEIPGAKVAFNGIEFEPECLSICCLANIRPVKGHKTLIEAASFVIKRFPQARFFLVGANDSDKDYYDALNRQITELGVSGAVKFTGEVSFTQAPALLSSMDICVLPSLSEGMSNTLLESMSAGKPVVATAVGGNTELVEHGKTGFLVPPEDPQVMADALVKLLLSPGLRRKMGLQARYKAEKEFSTEKMVERYEALLRKVHMDRQSGYKIQGPILKRL